MAWYGVNFVLGVGLHSYGFGSGGMGYVMAYIVAQLVFIAAAYARYASSARVDTGYFPSWGAVEGALCLPQGKPSRTRGIGPWVGLVEIFSVRFRDVSLP